MFFLTAESKLIPLLDYQRLGAQISVGNRHVLQLWVRQKVKKIEKWKCGSGRNKRQIKSKSEPVWRKSYSEEHRVKVWTAKYFLAKLQQDISVVSQLFQRRCWLDCFTWWFTWWTQSKNSRNIGFKEEGCNKKNQYPFVQFCLKNLLKIDLWWRIW